METSEHIICSLVILFIIHHAMKCYTKKHPVITEGFSTYGPFIANNRYMDYNMPHAVVSDTDTQAANKALASNHLAPFPVSFKHFVDDKKTDKNSLREVVVGEQPRSANADVFHPDGNLVEDLYGINSVNLDRLMLYRNSVLPGADGGDMDTPQPQYNTIF